MGVKSIYAGNFRNIMTITILAYSYIHPIFTKERVK